MTLIAIGYLVFLLAALIGIRRKKFLYGSLLGAFLIILGMHLNDNFWEHHNENMCQKLREDIFCIETESGFQCTEPSLYGNMATLSSICRNALSPEDRENANVLKRKQQLAEAKLTGTAPPEKIPDLDKTIKALDKFKSVAKTIILSQNPQHLDFENTFIAIYNCLEGEYGTGLKGELIASNILRSLIKTPENREKYMSYHAAKGRHLNHSALVAGLPAGDRTLGCNALEE